MWRNVAKQVGMTSINDFATTYMCQSLPFGGVKHSGFGRFGGVEGLRALCVPKAVAEDRSVLALPLLFVSFSFSTSFLPPFASFPALFPSVVLRRQHVWTRVRMKECKAAWGVGCAKA